MSQNGVTSTTIDILKLFFASFSTSLPQYSNAKNVNVSKKKSFHAITIRKEALNEKMFCFVFTAPAHSV